jgi:hypothetical protein
MSAWVPFANASLVFDLNEDYTTDPDTGNVVETTESVTYSAYLKPQNPQWKALVGADETSYLCEGRLLAPSTLDARVANGAVAKCTLNGVQGSFQLRLELALQSAYQKDLHQRLVGTFQAIGRGSTANV